MNENIKLNPAASSDLIAEVEIATGFTFPEEFKELYSLANGFSDFDWRKNMFSVWPLERILKCSAVLSRLPKPLFPWHFYLGWANIVSKICKPSIFI